MGHFRFGHCAKGIFVYVIGLVPFMILIYVNRVAGVEFWYNLLIFFGCFMNFMGIMWIILHVRKNRLSPLLNDSDPDEMTAIRVTKDGIIVPQFVPKGLFGIAKTIIFGENADFTDNVDFPLRTISGNPAIIVFDWLNTAIDLKRSVARKHWRKHVPNGPDAYKQFKEKKYGGKK
jgi:hypothetical protein